MRNESGGGDGSSGIDMVEEFHHSLANVEVRKFVDESW